MNIGTTLLYITALLSAVLLCISIALHKAPHAAIVILFALANTLASGTILYTAKGNVTASPAVLWIPPAFAALCAAMVWQLVQNAKAKAQALHSHEALHSLHNGYLLISSHNCLLDANEAALRYFPFLRQLGTHTPLTEVPAFPQELLQSTELSYEITLEQNGQPVCFQVSRSTTSQNNTCLLLYDSTENHHLLEELTQRATHDSLTGLLNRGTFFQVAGHDFNLARRTKEVLSVMMLDIDHFKQVNDVYGHICGDLVLREIATLLRGRLRATDVIARYGGEELCVFLPGATTEGVMMIAEILRRTVEQKEFLFNTTTIKVTISIGVAVSNSGRFKSIEEFLAAADKALYNAKESGRNRVCLYEPAP